jgi:hypothetical protein
MKAAIAKLIFQVHRLPEPENKFEFDEQVIVLSGESQETQVKEALSWAYAYETENNLVPSDGLRWEFIGIREMIPFQVGGQALPLCSGSLFMEEDKSFIEHIRLKSRALEKTVPLFL